MKVRELQKILDGRPSLSGNSFFVLFLYGLCALLTAVLFFAAAAFFLEAFFGFKIILNWFLLRLKLSPLPEERSHYATVLACTALIFSAIFGGCVALCRMILKRNHFIILTEDWLFANIPELVKPPKTQR